MFCQVCFKIIYKKQIIAIKITTSTIAINTNLLKSALGSSLLTVSFFVLVVLKANIS